MVPKPRREASNFRGGYDLPRGRQLGTPERGGWNAAEANGRSRPAQ